MTGRRQVALAATVGLLGLTLITGTIRTPVTSQADVLGRPRRTPATPTSHVGTPTPRVTPTPRLTAFRAKISSGGSAGNAKGDPTGDPTGSAKGDPTGDPTGNTKGDPTGNTKGDPTGNAKGDPTGNAKHGSANRSTGACPATDGAPVRVAPGPGRTVALTFDDGPGPQTRAILDVLAAEHVHATFFVVGAAVRTDPAAVTRAAAEGHLIANHTWDHVYPRALKHGWTTQYLADQITRTDAAIVAATGRPTCFFRPPGGFLPPSVTATGKKLRESVVLWSVDPQDWAVQGAHDPGPARTAVQARQIYLAATAGRTQAHPVVLLHDAGGHRAATTRALPRIIAFYRSLGYRFVTLDGRS